MMQFTLVRMEPQQRPLLLQPLRHAEQVLPEALRVGLPACLGLQGHSRDTSVVQSQKVKVSMSRAPWSIEAHSTLSYRLAVLLLHSWQSGKAS
jgi:hypothetical protein